MVAPKRRSRPPFVLSRETERLAIDRAVREPGKRQMLYAMVDAVLRVKATGKILAAELTPILAGFETTDEAVWSRASEWLAKLLDFAPELSTAVTELSRHRSAVVRFNLCATLDCFPAEVAVPHLRKFLADRSARVRSTVPVVAVKAGYPELIVDFEAMLERERNRERRQDLKHAIVLLRGKTYMRSGWRIRKMADGSIQYQQRPD